MRTYLTKFALVAVLGGALASGGGCSSSNNSPTGTAGHGGSTGTAGTGGTTGTAGTGGTTGTAGTGGAGGGPTPQQIHNSIINAATSGGVTTTPRTDPTTTCP